jgi:hypothetical protein
MVVVEVALVVVEVALVVVVTVVVEGAMCLLLVSVYAFPSVRV